MLNTRLWKLYLFPFLVVLTILASEQLKTFFNKRQTFEQIAKETNALAELDQRIFETAQVAKAVDGDTIELTTGEKVRYVGIDTPETKHPTKGV